MAISLKKKNLYDVKNELGEGLYISNLIKSWVDIDRNIVYQILEEEIKEIKTEFKPSIVFGLKQDSIILGTDIGIIVLNLSNSKFDCMSSFVNLHDLEIYRSNDGIKIDNSYFIGFMHRKDPSNNKGFLYKISNNEITLIDDEIHIPNTFIQISERELLISDSAKNQIWLYKFDLNWKFKEKLIWKDYEGKTTPDGGCIIQDKILIAMWGDASIQVLDKEGNLITRLELDMLNPTNCKFDVEANSLWVTSAREGLTEQQLTKYPNSGALQEYSLEGIL